MSKSKIWTPKPKKAFGNPQCHFCNCILPEGSRWTNCPKCHSTYNDEYSPLDTHTVVAKRKINIEILGPKKIPITYSIIQKWENMPNAERGTGFACFYTKKQRQIPVQELTSYYHSEKNISDEYVTFILLCLFIYFFFLSFNLCVFVESNTRKKKTSQFRNIYNRQNKHSNKNKFKKKKIKKKVQI